MGQRIASLFAEIGADISGLKRGLAETKQELGQAGKDLVSFGKNTRKVFTNIALATFAATVAAKGLNDAYQFARAGAFLELTEKRFARLAEEIGTTADALRSDLREATRGTLSDMQLMEAAASVLSLRLVKNSDDAVRLSRVIAALGADVGEVTLALTNQTTRRFDQIGIAVDGFDERLQNLKARGMDVESAFTEAFLQQAEAQIERTGDIADETAGEFLILEARIRNAIDAAKEWAALRLEKPVKYINQNYEALDLVDEAIRRGIISQEEFSATMRDMNMSPAQAALYLFNDLTVAIAETKAELDGIAEANASWDQAMQVSAGIIETHIDKTKELKQGWDDLRLFVQGDLGSAFTSFGEEQMALLEQFARLRDEIAYLEGQPVTAEGQAHLQELRSEMGNVEQAIWDQAAAFDEQTRRMLLDLIIQRAAIAELPEEVRGAALQMVNDLALAWGLIDQNTYEAVGRIDRAFGLLATGNVQAAKAALFELGGWANAVAGDYYIRFHVSVDETQGGVNIGDMGSLGSLPPSSPINNAANNFFPPGTFTPGGGGFGGSSGFSGSGTVEAPPTLRMRASPFLDTANALSSIGNIFAQRLQDEVIDPLQKKIDAIDSLLSPQHIDMVAREQALQLEQERAQAAEDIAEAQEKILMFQKAQMNLQFLEQQIRLLDLIRENGLDAGDILGGLKLGIDADAGEVVEAMARAIQALIAQAEKELGIASPSKVAAGWGKYIIQGLAQGMATELNAFPQIAPVVGDLIGGSVSQSGNMSPVGAMTINVYPSEGMNEQDLARKVGEVIQEKLYA